MDATITIKSQTRYGGAPLLKDTVLRVPEDVDIQTARRWCSKRIAVVGGEFEPGPNTSETRDELPFAELERTIAEREDNQVEKLMERTKSDLLDIAKANLVDVNPRMKKEEIAQAIAAANVADDEDGEDGGGE